MRTAIAIIILVCVAGVAYWWLQRDTVESVQTSLPFRYGFELRNGSNEVIRGAQLRVFGPADLPGRQVVTKLDANLPYTSERDDHGNHSLVFDLPFVPPFGTKSIVITGEVNLWSPGQATELVDPTPFLMVENKVQSDDALITQEASRIAAGGGSRPELAKRIAEFVHGHVQDIGYLSEDRGAVYALKEKQGDCTEYMSLFTALARASDVPTRRMAGFLVRPGGAVLGSGAYHNWAEFHDGRRWNLVDAQRNLINENQETYLTFRVLTESSQLSTTQRFFAADPRLEIKLL